MASSLQHLNQLKEAQQDAHRQAVRSGSKEEMVKLLRESSGFAAAILDDRTKVKIKFK